MQKEPVVGNVLMFDVVYRELLNQEFPVNQDQNIFAVVIILRILFYFFDKRKRNSQMCSLSQPT